MLILWNIRKPRHLQSKGFAVFWSREALWILGQHGPCSSPSEVLFLVFCVRDKVKGVEGKRVWATSPSLPTMGSRLDPPEAPEGTETNAGQAASQVLPVNLGSKGGPGSCLHSLRWTLVAQGTWRQVGFPAPQDTRSGEVWAVRAATDLEGPALGRLFHGWCSCPNIHKRLSGIKDGKVVVSKATGGGSVITTYP